MKRLVLALIAVILVAGCVGDLDFFKSEITGPQTTELGSDIVTTQNINIIPNPPILAENDFTFTFEIKNQDDINEVEDVNVKLYDTGLCTPPSVTESAYSSLVPDQTEFIEWDLVAPTNAQIGSMQATCPLKYKVTYDYSAKTQVDSKIISETKLRQLQRAGETPEYTPNQIIGRGPIKIEFSFGANQPVRTDTTFPVYIRVEDKGSGLLDFEKGDIPTYALVLQVHKDFVPKSCSKFEEVEKKITGPARCVGESGCERNTNEDDCETDPYNYCLWRTPTEDVDLSEILRDFTPQPNYNYYWNNATIAMVKKRSTELRCSFTTPSEDIVSDEKTYYFTAFMDYTYKMDFEEEISINPTLET